MVSSFGVWLNEEAKIKGEKFPHPRIFHSLAFPGNFTDNYA